MYPGALVTDIGHFKEVWIESGLSERFLKYGLMGSRTTGGDNEPVQAEFPDDFPDVLLIIL
jgi:hypothetical protein